ncbi:hypothetical protein MNBD_GAMMA25-655 [hydrothermal vent metagenome]|uniref:Outer membrane protein beta-barrel domain-containing protein n=1 Tax=hydrothermal vent metagenome TaxID=652676 RepID=A0A3B1AVY4_9ZZZZ
MRTGFLPQSFRITLFGLLFTIAAQANEHDDKFSAQINYAYANYLGTGIYTAADRAVQIYHMPFSIDYREPEPPRYGLRFRLPVTAGFINFKLKDIADAGLPNRIETLTFVPGLALVFRLRENWTIMPFADLGVGHDFATNNTAMVYGAGIKSIVTFDLDKVDFTLFNEFLFAGNTTADNRGTNDFSRLETGFSFQKTLPFQAWDRKTALRIYYSNFLYTNSLEFLQFTDNAYEISTQNEVGITFDTDPDMELVKIGLSGIGIGYRFGNKISVYRLVFGLPF